MSQSVARPEQSLKRLHKLRNRRRTQRNVNGLLRLLGWMTFLVWLSFFLDWTLELPVGVRVFHLFAALALIVIGVRVLWFGPRRRLSLDQLASRVEDSVGDLDQALITAVQLAGSDNPRSGFYSPALLARTVREAEERMAKIPTERLFSRKKLLGSVGVLLLLCVPMVLLASSRRDLATTYVERNLFMSSVRWPREYQFELMEPVSTTGETLLAMGDSLTVTVRKVRGGNARVVVDVAYDKGERESFSLERKGEDRYRKLFRNVTQDFTFVVEGGDYTSAPHRVVVRLRPRIEEIELTYDYPDYTELPDTEGGAASLGGHVKAPVGTVIAYRAVTSLPVKAATRVEKGLRVKDTDEARQDELAVKDGRFIEGSFTVEADGYYEFRLVSEDGFENSSPIRYRIAMIPDQPPVVHVVKPGRNLEVSPRASFPITIEALDDYGVVSGVLVFRTSVEGDEASELRLPLPNIVSIEGEEPANPAARKSRRSETVFQADLQNLSGSEEAGSEGEARSFPVIEEGARIEYLVEVRDAIDQVGSSRTYLLTVVGQEDLVRIIQDDLGSIRESLEETLEVQREARREMERILDDTKLAGGSLQKEELPNVRHSRLNQDKIGQRLVDSEEKFQDIIDRVRDNRLNDVDDLPWIEGLRDNVNKMSQELSPSALDSLDDLARQATDQNAGENEIRNALGKMRENERALRKVLEDLGRWTDLRTIVRKLEDLLRTEQELEQKVQDRVKGELGN